MSNVTWLPVTRDSELKEGMTLKIVGKSERDSYKRITIKKVLLMKDSEREWVEILINKKKNYFFNLTAYLYNEPLAFGWVKELYYKANQEQQEGGE